MEPLPAPGPARTSAIAGTRRRHGPGASIGAIAVAGLLAGCGQASAPGGTTSRATATASASAAGSGSGSGSGGAGPGGIASAGALDVTVTGLPGGKAEHWTLTCDPAGGTHPAAAATCAGLARFANPFAAPVHGTMCPAIVVGPARATVTGDWRGQRIHLTLTQSSCDLIIWNRLSQLLGGKPPT